MQVTLEDGSRAVVALSPETEVRSSGGFLGLAKNTLSV